MADSELTQQLRKEIMNTFDLLNVQKKRKQSFGESPPSKKQKVSHAHGNHNNGKNGKALKSTQPAQSKQSVMNQMRDLGLVQGSKNASSSMILFGNNENSHEHHTKFALPKRDDSWKRLKIKQKSSNQRKHKLNDSNTGPATKKRKINAPNGERKPSLEQPLKTDDYANIQQLHHEVNIYPFKAFMWYNLDKVLSEQPRLCGYTFPKKRLFSPPPTDSNHHASSFEVYKQVFSMAHALYNQLVSRDTVKNEFHKFTLSKGTFRDKISTWILRIDQFALTRLNHLDSMMNILQQNTKRQSVLIIPLLIDLFIESSPNSQITQKHKKKKLHIKGSGAYKGLLPDRHLLAFNDRLKAVEEDTSICELTQMDLILWYFEHLLKTKYRAFVELLEYYSTNCQVEKLRIESTFGLYKLLNYKRENELLILNLLINKFGEKDKDLARKIHHYLLELSTKHPLMKPDIITEINNYLMRPALSPIAMYRAVFFLSKLRFTSLENEAATLVCGIYMDLFKQLISYQNIFDKLNECNDKSTESRHYNINHDGVRLVDNELFSYIFDNNQSFTNQDPKLNKLNKLASIKNNEYQIMKRLMSMSNKKRNHFFKSHPKESSIWRRFIEFEASAPKLLTCILKGIAYAFPFASLNLKMFKSDLDYIYKLTLKSNMKIALMALQFTFRVEATAETNVSGTDITDKTPRALIKFGKNRVEQSIARKATPSDRFYQVLYSICSRWDFVACHQPELLFNLVYQSIKCDTDKRRITAFVRRLVQFCSYGDVSWVCGSLYLFSAILKIHPFLSNMLDLSPLQMTNHSLSLLKKGNDTSYNLYQYEPKLSNSNLCPLWEMNILRNHMHPAVRDFVRQLLENKNIDYQGDPLKDFQRKVLFEKFTRILAHKMQEFTPKTTDAALTAEEKQKLLDSYLVGDEFIAIYKQHEKQKEKEKDEDVEAAADADDEDAADLDEEDPEDAGLADEAMFKWLRANFGSEVPDDQFDDEEEYDYSEFKQEIEEQEKQKKAAKKRRGGEELDDDEDVDIYVSDVDVEEDDDLDMDMEAGMHGMNEEQIDLDEEEDYLHEEGEDLDMEQMTEEERTKIGNRLLLNEIGSGDVLLPENVEFAPEEPSEDEGDGEEAKFVEDEEEEEDDDGIEDFFAGGGIGAGELRFD